MAIIRKMKSTCPVIIRVCSISSMWLHKLHQGFTEKISKSHTILSERNTLLMLLHSLKLWVC